MSGKIKAIQRRFDRSAAGAYDAHAHVQRLMAERLFRSLSGWSGSRESGGPTILEIGCGTGAFTEMLADEWPRANITAIDIAPSMLRTAEQRVRSGVRFVHADVEKWVVDVPEASFDLIVSSACFQWLSVPEATLAHLRRAVRPKGLLAFTTFGPHTFQELHQAFDDVYHARGMEPQRHGLSFPSADRWQSWLQNAGFACRRAECVVQTETYASPREFLHTIKVMGASASQAAATRGLSPRSLFAGMDQAYKERYSVPGGIAATYDLLLIHAEAQL